MINYNRPRFRLLAPFLSQLSRTYRRPRRTLEAFKEIARLAALDAERVAKINELLALDQARVKQIDELLALHHMRVKQIDELLALDRARLKEIDELLALHEARLKQIDELTGVEVKRRQAMRLSLSIDAARVVQLSAASDSESVLKS